ncbi:MAG: hypothetical protein Q8M96_03740, partial [Rubrivivax sp.]|nr:hypothetical protein [Rubrivivax sp.]
SVLNAAGMAELAFGSVEEYRCAIQALALEPDLAAGYKRQLNEQRNTLRLFDSSRYTREFEALLARMWAQWQSGRAPDHLIAA